MLSARLIGTANRKPLLPRREFRFRLIDGFAAGDLRRFTGVVMHSAPDFRIDSAYLLSFLQTLQIE